MAFNLKKVLKAWLLSTNQPLSIKDVQGAFTRFHDQAVALVSEDAEVEQTGSTAVEALAAETPTPAPIVAEQVLPDATAAASAPPLADEPAEVVVEVPHDQDPELYVDVPSLITATQIREAMDSIAADLRAADEGVVLIEGNSGFRLVTHPKFGRWLRILRQEPPPVKLSQSSIETLAVIAYRQPVTRGEIETIRGVSAEAGITKLLERELIYITGRADSPGRPIQYGTTDQFLEFIGVKSLDELPASDVLSSRQIDEWLKNSSSAHKPNDADMGLSDEQLPLEGAAVAAEPAVDATTETADEPSVATEGQPPTQA